MPAEVERQLRLSDTVLRFMTIVLDRDISLEAAKAEIAAEEEARAAARQRSHAVVKDDDDDAPAGDEFAEDDDNA